MGEAAGATKENRQESNEEGGVGSFAVFVFCLFVTLGGGSILTEGGLRSLGLGMFGSKSKGTYIVLSFR